MQQDESRRAPSPIIEVDLPTSGAVIQVSSAIADLVAPQRASCAKLEVMGPLPTRNQECGGQEPQPP